LGVHSEATELGLADHHQAQFPVVPERGAAWVLKPRNCQTRTLRARFLRAVITNLLFAEPRTAFQAARDGPFVAVDRR
jgi:hypothetical protein